MLKSPLGPLYVAVSPRGLYRLDFGVGQADFLCRLDQRARLRESPRGVVDVVEQLRAYFAGERFSFTLPVDLSTVTPFQRRVLEVTRRITPGDVWTYQRVAEELGRPASSRPVGQALARNPIPIVIPCHRVIASDGSLRGYSGGSGIAVKRWLLDWEHAPGPQRTGR
jgi:methylated-DNA-[protein]-cysteine S-methyltransferase